MASLSLLIPVYNEISRVEAAIEEIRSAELPVDSRELVVVDDGSTDGTRELLRGREWPDDVQLHFHDRNRGKGAALQTALEYATCDYSAIMDADLEYETAEYARMLEPLLDGRAQAVFGTRGFESHAAFNFWYVVGNKSVTMAANVLYNSWLADIMTCQKVMPTELFRSLDLRENGFGIEPEITARLLRKGVPIYEVPITYNSRPREEGKKLTSMDGFRVLRTLMRCRFT
jgi:glycosyltransferase involved in cell wall biosynthesis